MTSATMRWRRDGVIFDPSVDRTWGGSHAQVPTVLVRDDVLRVYYADRNADGKSFMTYIDVDRRDGRTVLYRHLRPMMQLGAPGTFDDDGMMPSYVMRESGRVLLYYSGWNRGLTVPYRNAIGIAVSDDDGDSFTRLFEGPVMDRNAAEPYIAVTPTILREGPLWRMWYISGTRWVSIEGRYEPVYVIKYAFSADGVRWERPNHLCIEPAHDLEAYSHPSVIKQDGVYRMWFCSRHSIDYRNGKGSYRIGYAESTDGLTWRRDDARGGLGVGPDGGWDSLMTCYPYVVELAGSVHLFYNGNGFGQTGIGHAVLET
jgi:hypothetical protein